MKRKGAKERIIDAAIELFANKGFAAVGIREIAGMADINVSMISYYFDGKAGILKEIINKFFDSFETVIADSISDSLSFENAIFTLVKRGVNYAKENRGLFKIAFHELPYDIPGIAEIRASKITRISDILRENIFSELATDNSLSNYIPIIGPAVMTMVFSNFILGPAIQTAFKIKFDNSFYTLYSRIITDLMLQGLPKVVSDIKEGGPLP